MSVTDLPVRVVDDFVPTDTAYIVIRYNRDATPIQNRERQPEAPTRAHVVCALLRERGQKKPVFSKRERFFISQRGKYHELLEH